MPEPFRVVIADDEKPARRKIRMFMEPETEFSIVGEAADGLETLEIIKDCRPDLVFLDIQMPGLTGFEVIDTIGAADFPYVIFTTAYDEHALKAFEVHAVDYLLKPFTAERFRTALGEFRSRRGARGSEDRILDALQSIYAPDTFLQRVLIRDGERVFPVKLDDVLRISAEEKYVRLHLKARSYLYRTALSSLVGRLDPRKFVRVHRSEVLNLDFIAELQPWSHGDYVIILRDGNKIPLSRTYREQLLRALGA
jgi:two-component system, LytTR family, response regulator